jgi:P4 family phage/plasmid primase-like protien
MPAAGDRSAGTGAADHANNTTDVMYSFTPGDWADIKPKVLALVEAFGFLYEVLEPVAPPQPRVDAKVADAPRSAGKGRKAVVKPAATKSKKADNPIPPKSRKSNQTPAHVARGVGADFATSVPVEEAVAPFPHQRAMPFVGLAKPPGGPGSPPDAPQPVDVPDGNLSYARLLERWRPVSPTYDEYTVPPKNFFGTTGIKGDSLKCVSNPQAEPTRADTLRAISIVHDTRHRDAVQAFRAEAGLPDAVSHPFGDLLSTTWLVISNESDWWSWRGWLTDLAAMSGIGTSNLPSDDRELIATLAELFGKPGSEISIEPNPLCPEDNFEAARFWQDKGYCAVPNDPTDKHPSVGWRHLQTRSSTVEEVRQWKPKFGGGVGLICGRQSSRTIVIDSDSVSAEVLKKYVRLHGPLPMTLIVRTGKGFHLHYNPGDRNIKKSINVEISTDIQAEKGYAVLPPSPHYNKNGKPSGLRYQLIGNTLEVALLPDGLIEFLEKEAADAKRAAKGVETNVAGHKKSPTPNTSPNHHKNSGAIPREFPAFTRNEAARVCSAFTHAIERGDISIDDRDDHMHIGLMWKNLTEHGWPVDACWQLFDALSGLSEDHYDKAENRKQWDTYQTEAQVRADGKEPLTILSLFKRECDYGWGWWPGDPEPSWAVDTLDQFFPADLEEPRTDVDEEPEFADEIEPVLPNPTVNPLRYRRTDAGNGLLFAALYKTNIRYVEAFKAWIAWNGRRWVPCSDTAMFPAAREATEHTLAWAAKHLKKESEALTTVRKFATATQKVDRLRAMLALAKGEPSIRVEPEVLDADAWQLGTPSGTLGLRTGKLHKPRREDFITKSISVSPDVGARCPNFLKFLSWALMNDTGTIDHMKRIAGYILTGDVSEEMLFAGFGNGNNGKTTLVTILLTLMGNYGARARKELLISQQGREGAASPDVAKLKGKRLIVVSETDAECTLAEAEVKAIVSNTRIAARELYQNPFEFEPSHKIFLDTNHKPFIRGTDTGIWRRINNISFDATLVEDEVDIDFLKNKLRPELPGILNWALEGCLAWQREGLKPSEKVLKAQAEYREAMDFVKIWVSEVCTREATAASRPSELYRAYKYWAEDEGYLPLGGRRFGNRLVELGFPRDKCGDRLHLGIRLKTYEDASKEKAKTPNSPEEKVSN